jgi:hypothetical protein
VAEKLNTSAQGTLGVNGQFIGIHEDDAFEHIIVVTLHIGFCEVFELIADKTDALSVGAIDKHDVGFDAIAVASVDLVDEIADDGAFAGPGRPVENQIRNLANGYEIVQLFDYICVFRVHLRRIIEKDLIFYIIIVGILLFLPQKTLRFFLLK